MLYIRPIRRILLLISSTGQCSELSFSTDSVLAGPLTYQIIVSRAQCSTSSGLLSIDFNTLRKSVHLAMKSSILPNQGKAYLPHFCGYHLGIKKGSLGRKGNC